MAPSSSEQYFSEDEDPDDSEEEEVCYCSFLIFYWHRFWFFVLIRYTSKHLLYWELWDWLYDLFFCSLNILMISLLPLLGRGTWVLVNYTLTHILMIPPFSIFSILLVVWIWNCISFVVGSYLKLRPFVGNGWLMLQNYCWYVCIQWEIVLLY